MNAADAAVTTAAATTAAVSTATLIRRAGAAVAYEARAMMGGTYGRRVLLVCGKGNNGADGRFAAEVLGSWGARCDVVAPEDVAAPDCGECYDLVVDAAYGTGLRSPWHPGPQPRAPVLAVDVPSGVDALTGQDHGSWSANTTLTFAALKTGLLLHPGAARVGRLRVVGIGDELATAIAQIAHAHLLTDTDAHGLLAQTPLDAHKWQTAVRVIAGSERYRGAGHFTCAAAQQAGAGLVALSSPGLPAAEVGRPLETVALDASADRWAEVVLEDLDRFGLLVIGPGLGTDPDTLASVAELIATCPLPVVIDADAISAVAANPSCVQGRSAATVLTPHEGEYALLAAAGLGAAATSQDRFTAVAQTAQALGAVVLLKGPTTLIGADCQHVYAVTSGTERLATAGAGDVLTGVIAATLAADMATRKGQPWLADRLAQVVAAAAHWHGRTATLTTPLAGSVLTTPLTASTQIDLLPAARSALDPANSLVPAQHLTPATSLTSPLA